MDLFLQDKRREINFLISQRMLGVEAHIELRSKYAQQCTVVARFTPAAPDHLRATGN